MKKNKSLELFSESELNTLEMLEIRGGRTMYSEEVQIGEVCGEVQFSCKTYSGNCVAGCACRKL